MANKLSDTEIAHELSSLDGWNKLSDRSAIFKKFKFEDFKSAWRFMEKIANLAEKMNHHPEWFNVYSTVEITLTTHDADGISPLDIEMAKTIEGYL